MRRSSAIIDEADNPQPVLVLLFLHAEFFAFRRKDSRHNRDLMSARLKRARQFQGQHLSTCPILGRKTVHHLNNSHTMPYLVFLSGYCRLMEAWYENHVWSLSGNL